MTKICVAEGKVVMECSELQPADLSRRGPTEREEANLNLCVSASSPLLESVIQDKDK